MASLTATSVVSAAIISGDLIIGLSDGSIINCGRCQGPQGLDGPQGAIGSTGRSGQDGNTILTSEGTPRPDLGVVGDYVIDKTKWNIYGPKSSGGWGSPTPLRGNGKGAAATKRDLSDGVPTTGEGGGGGGLRYNTSNLPLTGFGRGPEGRKASINADGGNIIDSGNGLSYQSNLNKWVYESLQALDKGVPVALVESPRAGAYEGELGFYQGDLYLWANSKWEIIGGGEGGASVEVGDTPPAKPEKGDLWFCTQPDELTLYIYEGGAWVPAAPPVSLDGVNATIEAALIVQAGIQTTIEEASVIQADLVDVVTKGIEEQNKIKLDLEELQVTKGSVARYKITATNIGAAGRNGELYVMSPVAADVQAMSFAPFDLNGQPIKPCNPGDIIELVEAVALANVGEVTRYRIVSGDSNALTVEYLSGTNNFEVDDTQEVYIYPQNETGVSKDYVDDSLDGKLNNAGANDLPDGTDWKVRQQTAAGSNKTLFQVKAGELGVYNLKEPTESHHAATKAYVDAKPSGGSGGGISASRPPGLKFNVSIVNLPDGYFNWWTNNSTNNQHLELATTDKDGIAWGTNTCREDVRYSDKIPFTIWEVSNNAWKMKVTGTISRIDFHPDHALCYVSSKTALNGGNFVNGAGPYYITISGLF